jgi:hypothetical protein
MKPRITTRRKFIIGAGVFMLAFAVVINPVGRRDAVRAFAEFVQIAEMVTELPGEIITDIENFSLDRLDPTRPQCL